MALTLVLVVIAFAIVQSVFGVGLLVFGTPTLLILGYSFEETLAYLLPSSIAISLLQLMASGGFRLDPMRRQFLRYTAPLVLVGSALILTIGSGLDIRLLVGGVLIVSGAIRFTGRWREALSRLVRRHLPVFLVILGAIHGLSNLGGGVLTLIVGSTYDDKEDVRRQVAFCYAMMAAVQLAILTITVQADLDPRLILALPVLAAATYILLGNRAFRAASHRAYQTSLTAMIIAFGVVMVAGL